MEFGALTRGPGKIYQLLRVDCSDSDTVVAFSVAGNNRIPVVVIKKENTQNEYVLVLPVLYVSQTITVRLLNNQGRVLDEEVRKIGHFSSAVTSKFNTFSKADGVDAIRNYDRFPLADEAHIDVKHINRLGYGDGSELVHLVATVKCANEADALVPFSLRAFDRSGEDFPISSVSVFSDVTNEPVPSSGLFIRTIRVSFRKQQRPDWYFIELRFDNDALPCGFVSIDKWKNEYIRERFEKRFSYNGQGAYYEPWFFETQKCPPLELEAQRLRRFDIEPTFSVIVPLYRTPIGFFEEMAASVLSQTYGKIELVLVNASPEDEALAAAVDRLRASDARVRVVELERNMGIALNTNEGIRVAGGDFLSFFDHDDVLEPNLFYEYVDAINRYPETDLLYCDEDKLSDGHLIDGFLKPDFNWGLITTCNYVCHLLTVRRSVVDEVDLSGDDVAGAQDWDMTLKVAERARNVFHVRRVLYHWRKHELSAAASPDAKPYTHLAGEVALRNHFERIGVPAAVADGPVVNTHRIDYLLPRDEAKVSIIIPTKDQVDMLGRCLESVFEKTSYGNYEVILVENNSTEDATFAYYDEMQARHENLRVIRYEGAFNFASICNRGAESAAGDYLLFLNNDTEVITGDWIERLLGPLQREEVAATGAKLLYPDDTIQHVGVIIPKSEPKHVACQLPRDIDYYFGMIQNARDVIAVTGACLMVSREDFDSVDGFDETFAVAYNDVDFCLRLRERGKSIVIEPRAELYHYESISRGYDHSGERHRRKINELGLFMTRWDKYVSGGDPWYGTNIDVGSAEYGLDFNVNK